MGQGLEGKVAIVTGAGSGIGLAAAVAGQRLPAALGGSATSSGR